MNCPAERTGKPVIIDTAFERLQEIQKAKNEPVWELVFSSGVGAAAFD